MLVVIFRLFAAMKLFCAIAIVFCLCAPSHSTLVVLRPPKLDEFFQALRSASFRSGFWRDPLAVMKPHEAVKVCAELSIAKIIVPKEESSLTTYSQFSESESPEYKRITITVGEGTKPILMGVLTCFTSEESDVYLSHAFTENFYFVFAKPAKNAAVKLIGQAERNLVQDEEHIGHDKLSDFFREMLERSDGDLMLLEKMNDFLSLTENQKFRLCGLAYDGSMPTNKLKKYTLELPDEVNAFKLMPLDVHSEEDVHTTAINCVIRTPEQHEVQFYLILDPSDIHSIFLAISFRETEGNKVVKTALWLMHRFINVHALYVKLFKRGRSP